MTAVPDKSVGRLVLVPGKERRVLAGHLWVYAGDLESDAVDAAPGAVVDLYAANGRFCGRGFFNPHSKIRVRLLTHRPQPIDAAFWERRIKNAIALRQRVVSDTNAYRLIHGEGDLLPGLIVDRYADVLVMQTLSFGMDVHKELLADILLKETGAKAVYLRNDPPSRTLEGLPRWRGFLHGEGPTAFEIYEGNARFSTDIERGQKTGWFCDQRENRQAVARLAREAEVLDAFCHTGAFGVQAVLHGARSLLGLDASVEATALAGAHAALNSVADRCVFRTGDVFEELRRLERRGASYDLIILDPPAFAKSRQTLGQALTGYKEINRRALKLLRPQGILASCSCSHHVAQPDLWRTILEAAHDAHRHLRLIEARSQARDHPVLAAMPETQYLKCFIVQAI
jgi:23S rRNA (cytosine1962-C5)-methyltransferase